MVTDKEPVLEILVGIGACH